MTYYALRRETLDYVPYRFSLGARLLFRGESMFGKHSGALDVPPVAQKDPKAVEVARVWMALGDQHVSIRPDA